MVALEAFLDRIPDRIAIAALVLIAGILLGMAVDRVNRRILRRAGIPEAVEGTAFERTARSFGTSTVSLLARLSMWFIIGVAALAALSVAQVRYTELFWSRVTAFLPQLFVAIVVLIVGVVVGDKLELVIGERLRGVKLPQIGVIPLLAKYSVVYIAILLALNQLGVATNALLILLAVYVFGLVFLSGIAFRDMLASGAAGMYLLLAQPYEIGDEVTIDDRRGIVQDVDMFVTHIEANGEEYVVPNRTVLQQGVTRVRS